VTAPEKSPGLGAMNPLHLLWRIFYGMANDVTQMVGVTPFQLVGGCVGLVLLALVVQLALVSRNRQGWHVEDVRSDREITDQIRKELAG
jgi:ammonia channel protein AmtB